jgi:DNA-binding NarL/FixJ family response regulator
MNKKPIRVLVVDDHFMVRLGLISAISAETDIEVVGETGTGMEAVALHARLLPDITLMDGILPDIHGLDAMRSILETNPAARILMVSINDTAEDVHRAMAAGACGYIPKSCEKEIIVHAIRAVADGAHYLPPDLSRKLAERDLQPLLSTRELAVLRLVARGYANKQIAAELAVGEATVKTHIRHILEKLDAPDRTRAVTLALERGILRG